VYRVVPSRRKVSPMNIEPLPISGAWTLSPRIYQDDRGSFREWFKASALLEHADISFEPKQSNVSTSAKNVVRGIHYSLARQGQAKLITCLSGRIWDVIVDIRTGSPTFGQWEGVELSPENGKSVFISSGLGHGFSALENGSVAAYLLSSEYDPVSEKEINPLDPLLGIDWKISTPILSEKDQKGPSLESRRDLHEIPHFVSGNSI
jgi:dTDP-4-dehydrorhamnose 3,5-epimerase